MNEQGNVEVVKGGILWLELSVGRNAQGLDIFAKVDPKIEEFFQSLGNGINNSLEMYGRSWYSVPKGRDLRVYDMERDITPSYGYFISKPNEVMKTSKDSRINLSFLRFVGISEPEGIRFGVEGAYSKPYVMDLSKEITVQVKNFLQDYIVPVYVNIRISSQIV